MTSSNFYNDDFQLMNVFIVVFTIAFASIFERNSHSWRLLSGARLDEVGASTSFHMFCNRSKWIEAQNCFLGYLKCLRFQCIWKGYQEVKSGVDCPFFVWAASHFIVQFYGSCPLAIKLNFPNGLFFYVVKC